MPKFLAGVVVVKTWETWADDDVQAEEYIRRFQEGETEEPEGGVKSIRYKLEWTEGVACVNPVKERDGVLAAFLNLMLNVIPGVAIDADKPRILSLDDVLGAKKKKKGS
jgi:hypothetical protein